MHPILARTDRLALYLSAWFVVGVLLASVLPSEGLGWIGSFAFLLPLVLFFSFVCLSAWYVCRATPLASGSVLRALSTALLAALIASGLLAAATLLWIGALTSVPMFAPAEAVYRRQMPFLFAAGVLLYLLAVAVHYVVLALDMAREAERRGLELQVLSRDAELRALRAQVDPHFLYNSLNSISALTGSDPAGARRMCVLLGDFLRHTLHVGTRERIPLSDELALADDFLNIEQVRFGARLRVERHVDDDAAQCLVPPLLLQPLVENAVTHGIAGLLEGGVIRLDVARQNGRLAIAIENPRDPDTSTARGAGVGLDNVRRRLNVAFGRDARVDTRVEPTRFRVEIDLPWTTHD
jgi:hypothetical protein